MVFLDGVVIGLTLPPGRSFSGAVEESDKANKALAAVAPVMLVTILLILMLQLQSFSTMTMVFLTAPLGLVGVVPAARSLLERAEHTCLISNSLKGERTLTAEVVVASDAP